MPAQPVGEDGRPARVTLVSPCSAAQHPAAGAVLSRAGRNPQPGGFERPSCNPHATLGVLPFRSPN